MVKVTVDLDSELNKNVNFYKGKHSLKSKNLAIQKALEEFFTEKDEVSESEK